MTNIGGWAVAIDLPPKSGLWLPPRPAIVRANSLEITKALRQLKAQVRHPKRAAFPAPVFCPAVDVPWDFSYVGKVTDASSATSMTWTGVNIGPPMPGRWVLIIAMSKRGGVHTIDSLTVDGVAPAMLANGSTGAWQTINLYYLQLSEGSSVTIETTYSATVTGKVIMVFNLNGAASPIPYDYGLNDVGNASSATSAPLDIPANGVGIFAHAHGASGGSPSFSGGYGVESFSLASGGWGFARRNATTALTNVTQSCSWSPASGSRNSCYSWGPPDEG